MAGFGTSNMLDTVKEITIAQIANSPQLLIDENSAQNVADYMQVIYDKLLELDANRPKSQQRVQ